MESMTSLGNLTTVSPVNCSPWEDYVEIHNGDSCIGLVMFVHCIATILSNAVLFAVIFSKKYSTPLLPHIQPKHNVMRLFDKFLIIT